MFDVVVRALASNHPARVRFSDLVSHVGRVCCWFSPLLRGFFSGSSAFPPSIKTIILIPIRTGNSGQKEPPRGMSTPTYHLFFLFYYYNYNLILLFAIFLTVLSIIFSVPTVRRIIPTTRITTTVTTTRRQPPTPRPTVPTEVICSSTVRYDTVFVGTNRWTYFVVGDKFWILDRQLRRRGPYTITRYWRDIKTPLDAAYHNKKGNVVFFKGSE